MNSFNLLRPRSLNNLLPSNVRHLLLSALILLSGQAQCQNIDMHFSLYRTDTAFADALQTKLLAGGQDATQAMKMMPDLVEQGRATLLAVLNKQTPDKQREMVSSDTKMHKNRDGTESRLGLEIEFVPTIVPSVGIVECNLGVSYVIEEDEVVKSHRMNTSFTAKSTVPVLLLRWQEGDINLILIASATFESPGKNETPATRILYLDHAIYQTEADATANRNPVLRTVHPARSGDAASAGVSFEIHYKMEDEWHSKYAGWGFESEPTLAEDASLVFMRMVARHNQPTGQTGESPDEVRIPEMISRSANVGAQIKIGETHTVDMPVDQNAEDASKTPSWKLSSKCLLYEVK